MSGLNNLEHGDLENKASDRWYLAYTKPRQETVAHSNLEQQGFEAYLPLFKKFKKTVFFFVSFLRYLIDKNFFF